MNPETGPLTNPLTRREFVGMSALSLASLSTLGSLRFAHASEAELATNRLGGERLGVRFVYGGVIHETAHEGPCRCGRLVDLTHDAELDRHTKSFAQFARDLKERAFPPEAEVLEPADFEMIVPEKSVEFIFPESEFAKVEQDIDRVDLFVLIGGFVSDIAVRLGQRTNKPIAALGNNWVVDVPAALRYYGLEGHVVLDWEDLNRLIRLLWVRKAFARTKLLIVTDRFGQPPFGLAGAIADFPGLEALYGLTCQQVTNQEVADEMDRVLGNPEGRRRADDIAARLIENAQAVHMSKEDIVSSVVFYLATENLMNRYDCNAFTIECREICPLEMAAQYRFTPCLAMSLLKDAGYPAVCQTDINALMAMMALSYVARRSVFMGNPVFDVKKNIVSIFHDVAGLRMKGFDGRPLPYELRNFTMEGWGATLRYDFSRDRGEVVTLARFNPGQTRVLLTRGEIVGGFGVDRISCSLGVEVRVADALRVFRKMADFGGHFVMAYGDHVTSIEELAEIMPFEVVTVL